MIEILDANWIATLLSIVFSLYIFLLSIPTLFFQTFLPEEIREIYNKYDPSNGGMNEVKLLRNILLLALFFFGNHAIRYLLSTMSDSSILKPLFILLFYFSCLFYLVWFTYKSYDLFNNIVFVRKSSRKEVLININQKIEENYLTEGIIKEEYICDLAELSRSYSSFVNKELLINQLTNLIKRILNNETKEYDGTQLQNFIQDVLIDSVVSDKEFLIEKNYRQVINLCKVIAASQAVDRSTYDQQKLIFLLNKISFLSLDYDYLKPFDRAIDLLKMFDGTQDDLYKIYKKAFVMERYTLVSDEISNLALQLHKNKKGDINPLIANFFAYLSWYFSSEQVSMQSFASKVLSEFKNKKLFTIDDIDEAVKNFCLLSEYNTADAIKKSIIDFLELSVILS